LALQGDHHERHQARHGGAGYEGLKRINVGQHRKRLNGRRNADNKKAITRGI